MGKTERNIRFTLENSENERFFCVLNKEENYEEQLEKVFAIGKGYGFSVRLHGERLDIYDYFAGEVRASFRILKREDTDEAAGAHLQKAER